jgi:hypothetical protein
MEADGRTLGFWLLLFERKAKRLMTRRIVKRAPYLEWEDAG